MANHALKSVIGAEDIVRQDAFLVPPRLLRIVGYDTPDGREHPLWDPRVLEFKRGVRKAVAHLLDSVRTQGILMPLLVRRDGKELDVGIGRCRAMAARLVGEAHPELGIVVPVVVKNGWTDEDWRDAILAENIARRNEDAVAEAELVAERLKMNPSEKRLADRKSTRLNSSH